MFVPTFAMASVGLADVSGDAEVIDIDVKPAAMSRKRKSMEGAEEVHPAGGGGVVAGSPGRRESVASRVKRRRSVDKEAAASPLFLSPSRALSPARVLSPGARESAFFSPAPSGKRGVAWSVAASARRSRAAWDDFFEDCGGAEDWGTLGASEAARGAFVNLVDRLGPPAEKRAEAWALWVVDGPRDEAMLQSPGVDTDLEEMLLKDVQRTLRGTPYFRDGDGSTSLTSILRTFAVRRPEVGYVQGMNYVAAFLLLVGRDGDDDPARGTDGAALSRAYATFAGVVDVVRGYYVPGFPTLKRDVDCLAGLIKTHLPSTASVLDAARVEPITYAPRFLMTLFLHLLPGHVAARLWDLLLVTCRAEDDSEDLGWSLVPREAKAQSFSEPGDASSVGDLGGGHRDAASAVLLWALLAVVASADLDGLDDFVDIQQVLVDAAKSCPSWDKLKRNAPATIDEVRAAIDGASEATAADAPPPPDVKADASPRFPNTAKLVANLRDWFTTTEYAFDDVKKPKQHAAAPKSSAKKKRRTPWSSQKPRGDLFELTNLNTRPFEAADATAKSPARFTLDRALA